MESDAYNEVDSNTWLKGNGLGFSSMSVQMNPNSRHITKPFLSPLQLRTLLVSKMLNWPIGAIPSIDFISIGLLKP